MEFVIKISQFLLSLSLLIVLHELGHFIPAKLFKTKVEKFYLFFDVKYSLFKKKIGETVYGIGWLPLGGYVKIAGMIDESMDKEQMAQPPQPWEFRSKPAWQRLIIMLGGVTVNFILAWVIYVFMSGYYGDTAIATNSIKDGYLIENAAILETGIQTGDEILSVNGETYENLTDLTYSFLTAQEVQIRRDGVEQTITFPEDFAGRLSDSKKEDGPLLQLRTPFYVSHAVDTLHNSKADIKEGDLITAINDQKLRYFDEFAPVLASYKNQTVNATVERDGATIDVPLKVDGEGALGLITGGTFNKFEELGYLKITRKEYTFSQSFGAGTDKFIKEFKKYGEQLKLIFTPKTGAYKGVGGFKAIFDIFSDRWVWESFWRITAFLSIMLGVLNLLPIPALDGGHVMFLLYEMISGRKPSEKFLERAQIVGFFILIALVLFANGNDIFKAITR